MFAPGGHTVYVGPFLQIARQRSYWSPQRLMRGAWSFLSTLRSQMDLFRIFSLPAFKRIVLLDPIFPLRHLSREFLFPGLSAKERTASILHHYRLLTSRMSTHFLRQFGNSGVSVLEHRQDGKHFVVSLGLPAGNALMEGESVLQLLVDGLPVYVLQFTIVPGWLLNAEQQDVIFVQRLQGVKGCFEQVRAATRAFSDVAPRLLLITALQGIAAAWGIHEMACISAESQICSKRTKAEGSAALFRDAYDDFFVELGARRVSKDFFSLLLPIEEKPIQLVGNGHKARTRRRRAFRHEIANRVCHTLLEAA